YDEIEVVEQDPLGAVVSFHVRRLRPGGGERLHHVVGDRAHLSRVRTRRDHEVAGESRRLAQIEDREVLGLLVFGRSYGAVDLLRNRGCFPALLSLDHATCLPVIQPPDPMHDGPASSTYKVRAAQCVAARSAAPGPRSIRRARGAAGWQSTTRPRSPRRSK